jgi:hypothetical protein
MRGRLWARSDKYQRHAEPLPHLKACRTTRQQATQASLRSGGTGSAAIGAVNRRQPAGTRPGPLATPSSQDLSSERFRDTG